MNVRGVSSHAATSACETFAKSTQAAAWKVGVGITLGAIAGSPGGVPGMLAGAAYGAGVTSGLHLGGCSLKWGLSQVMPEPQADEIAAWGEIGAAFALGCDKNTAGQVMGAMVGGSIGKGFSDDVFPEESHNAAIKTIADTACSAAGAATGSGMAESAHKIISKGAKVLYNVATKY